MDLLIIAGVLFWLAPIQLVWAIIHEHFTRVPFVKKHFEIYFMSVVAFFSIFLSGSALTTWSDELQFVMKYLFVGSAIIIAGYHAFIVLMSIWLGIFQRRM